MIGTYLVQKRMSLMGDGIGHLAFAGVAAGILAHVAPVWTALAVAVIGAIAVDRLRSRGRAYGDLALAIFFYGGIALGVVLIGLADSLDASVLSYLFGQVLLVTGAEVVTVAALGAGVVITMLALRRPLFGVVSDEEWARVAGLPVDLLNAILAVLTAVAVVAAMRVVGLLLVAALMVLPVAAAQLIATSFRGTLAWAVGVGVGSVVLGLSASRIWGLAPGGTIVLVSAAVFGVISAAKRRPRSARSFRGGPRPGGADAERADSPAASAPQVLGDSH